MTIFEKFVFGKPWNIIRNQIGVRACFFADTDVADPETADGGGAGDDVSETDDDAAAEAAAAEQKVWDQQKAAADNARALTGQRDQALANAQDLKSQVDSTNQQLKEANDKLAEMQVADTTGQLDVPDPDDYDAVMRTVKVLTEKSNKESKLLAETNQKARKLEEENQKLNQRFADQQEQLAAHELQRNNDAGDKALNELCGSLEKDHGFSPKNRNEVLKKLSKLFVENDISELPTGAVNSWAKAQAHLMYQEHDKTKKHEKPKAPILDGGGGHMPPGKKINLYQTFEEATKEMNERDRAALT